MILGSLMSAGAEAQGISLQGWKQGLSVNPATTWPVFGSDSPAATAAESPRALSYQGVFAPLLTSGLVLGWGVSYNLESGPTHRLDVVDGSTGLKLREVYAMYIEPGYTFSQSSMLAYARLGYTGSQSADELGAGGADSTPFGRLGYGLGLRAMLKKNLYLQVELMQEERNRNMLDFSAYGSLTTTGSVGLGLRF